MTARSIPVRRPALGWLEPRRPALADAPTWAGAVAVAVGSIVLLGWILDVAPLKSMLLGPYTMKANAAVCFVLIGTGVVLLSRSAGNSRWHKVGLALVCAAVSVALLTFAQSVTGIDLGIDQLLFREHPGEPGSVVPGRMAPLASIAFTLLGLAAIEASRMRRLVVALCGVTLAISAMSVFDFVFGATVPPLLAGYTQLAVNAAVAMGILAAGVIGLLGPANPFALLLGSRPTAFLLRRLLIILVAVPVLMAWLRLEGQRLGLFDLSYGTSLMLVGILALGLIAILHSAGWANELETKREAMEMERDRFFDLSADMLSVIGVDGRFRRVNRAWEVVLGYRPDELVGRPLLDFVHPADLDRTFDASRRTYGKGERVEPLQNRYRHRNGKYRWLEWMSQTAPDGSVAFAVARDITDRKLEEARRAKQRRVLQTRNETLSESVVRDPLTGLHNRRYFDAEVARMEQRWSRLAADDQPPVSVIIFDLDHFGLVNNLHGHQAGDAVLRLFSGLLRQRFRETDLVARYGGEEFVAVLEDTTSAVATRIAEDVREAFERSSVDSGTDAPIRVTVSAGCAQLGDDRSTSAGLSAADVWLSQAKRAGRNQVVGL